MKNLKEEDLPILIFLKRANEELKIDAVKRMDFEEAVKLRERENRIMAEIKVRLEDY